MEEIRTSVRRIIADTLAVTEEAVESSDSLQQLPGVDSIKVLRIITKVEARYGVELDEQLVFNIKTLGELCTQVAELRAAKLPAAATA